jgi:hypothetical protein
LLKNDEAIQTFGASPPGWIAAPLKRLAMTAYRITTM